MMQNVLYRLLIAAFFAYSSSIAASAQNLISDPGAETDPIWNGWVNLSGNWHRGQEVATHEGTYHFYAGTTTLPVAELYQDVDVSSNSANINAGLATYTFSAWMRIYATLNDKGKIIVEYRDAASAVLYSYSTANNTSLSWTNYSNVHVAPAGTTTIRIRLQSFYIQGNESDGYMDDLSLTVVNSSTTPIHLMSFNAEMEDDRAAIYWATASETNNAYFTVEKSEDALNWTVVEELPGAGNSSAAIDYIIYDDDVTPAMSYYRLKQTDWNGAYTYSEIASINSRLKDVVIYPVPAHTELHVVAAYQPVTILCRTIGGQSVMLPYIQEGDDTVLDTSGLSSGVYVLEIQTDTDRMIKKFVVE